MRNLLAVIALFMLTSFKNTVHAHPDEVGHLAHFLLHNWLVITAVSIAVAVGLKVSWWRVSRRRP